MNSPRVSVIILNWNGLETTKKCLPSVVETTYPDLEIIFADNASSDTSVDWVRSNFPEVRIIVHKENEGYCRGNNLAFEQATGKYVVFLNNDVETPADWLMPLVSRMESEQTLAAIQPKLMDYANRERFEYAGAAGGFLDQYGYPFARGRIFTSIETDQGQYDNARYAFWATGSALMVRASAFSEVGMFDERFFMHMEEIDLCWRFHRLGYRVGIEPESQVYHVGGASLPQGSPQKDYYNFRNSLLILFKNLPAARFRRIMPGRLVLDALAFIRALFWSPRAAWAIIRAHASGHRMRSLYKNVRPQKDEPPVLPPYRASIVVAYYLKRIKTFAALENHLVEPISKRQTMKRNGFSDPDLDVGIPG